MTPGIGFDGYIGQIEEVVATGNQEALQRFHTQWGVAVVGPSWAEHLGLA
jgi:hypothetical protein